MMRIRKRSHRSRIRRARYSSSAVRGFAGWDEEACAGSVAENCTGSKGDPSASIDPRVLNFDRSELNIDVTLCESDEMQASSVGLCTYSSPLRGQDKRAVTVHDCYRSRKRGCRPLPLGFTASTDAWRLPLTSAFLRKSLHMLSIRDV
jgi:hypothetical protein